MKRILTIVFAAVVALTACKKDRVDAGEKFALTITDDGHGTASATIDSKLIVQAEADSEVTLTATANEGYVFDRWIVTSGHNIEIYSPTTSTATFAMAPDAVEIKATFRRSFEPAMVWVEPGTFVMGSDDDAAEDDEGPTHRVTLTKGYWIGKYEVTQAEWYALMDAAEDESPASFTGSDLPIDNVTYDEAMEYIARLNAATGKTYALPTEAQWEFAARGGTKSVGYTYSGGNILTLVGWYDINSNGSTHPVGTLLPNELGIYDMSGNVWEWTADWFSLYSPGFQTDPTGPASPIVDEANPSYNAHVYRGGCWDNSDRHSWPSTRGIFLPDNLSGNLGLRLVLIL